MTNLNYTIIQVYAIYNNLLIIEITQKYIGLKDKQNWHMF